MKLPEQIAALRRDVLDSLDCVTINLAGLEDRLGWIELGVGELQSTLDAILGALTADDN